MVFKSIKVLQECCIGVLKYAVDYKYRGGACTSARYQRNVEIYTILTKNIKFLVNFMKIP